MALDWYKLQSVYFCKWMDETLNMTWYKNVVCRYYSWEIITPVTLTITLWPWPLTFYSTYHMVLHPGHPVTASVWLDNGYGIRAYIGKRINGNKTTVYLQFALSTFWLICVKKCGTIRHNHNIDYTDLRRDNINAFGKCCKYIFIANVSKHGWIMDYQSIKKTFVSVPD